jgi:hypothetical protein
MNTTIQILTFIFDIVMPLIMGYILAHKTKVQRTKMEGLLKLNIYFLYPLMISLSTWIVKINKELLWLPIVGLLTPLIGGTLGFILGKKKFENSLDRGSYTISYMLSNRGTIGGLVAFIILGEVGYAYNQFSLIFNTITLYMIAYPIASYFSQSSKGKVIRLRIRDIIFTRNQIPALGILIGISLNLLNIQRPPVLGSFFEILIHIVAWCALLPIGMNINLKEMSKYKRLIPEISILKFIFMPLLMVSISSLIVSDEVILKTIAIHSSAPAAINSVIVSKIYNLNIHLTILAFVATTAIYIVVVFPALFLIL